MATLPQGYDFDFVSKLPDDCICEICHLVLRQPVQTKCCGHRFCKDCVVEATKRKPECPVDCKPLNIQQDVFDDKGTERNVKSLRIMCPRRSWGCSWQGELGDVKVHEQKCDYMIVPCTFQRSGCYFKTQRKNMEEHLEKKIKDHLALTSNCLSTLREENKKLKKTVEENIEQKMKDHLENENEKSKKTMEEHLENENAKLKKSMEEHLQKKMKNHLVFFMLSCFVIFLVLTPKENEKLKKTVAEMKEQVITMEDQEHLENKIKDRLALTSNILSSLQEENKKLKKTIAEMKEQVIPRTNKFIWKINNFSNDLEKAKKPGGKYFVYSDPFYTDKYGYKMRVDLYPDGSRNDCAGHVSVVIQILRGEYDALLPWPFARKITISLLDQKEDVKQRTDVSKTMTYKGILDNPQNFRRPTTDTNAGLGYGKFISHGKLMTENYIVDDTVFVQVEIGDEYTQSDKI